MNPPLDIAPGEDVLWMHAAAKRLGLKEVPGAKHNPEILAMWKRVVGYVPKRGDEEFWCAIAVGDCLLSAGVAAPKSALARTYLTWGVSLAEPIFGAAMVLGRTDDPAKGHVTFFLRAKPSPTAQRFVGRGGNQGNAFCDATYPMGRVLPGGIRWPADVPLPPGAKAGVYTPPAGV